MHTPNLYLVIMAGGAGTRFWPLSRRDRPKQLLPLGPGARVPLLRATWERVASLAPPERCLVVTGQALAEATRAVLPELPEENLLLEPTGRNTAPCVAWANAWVRRRDPAGVLCMLPADAFIARDDRFRTDLKRAAESAREGNAVVTLGITPTRPETGYGYLHLGPELHEGANVYEVERFVEKPPLHTAQLYLSTGSYLWNAGIFLFSASLMHTALELYLPEVARGIAALDRGAQEGKEAQALAEHWGSIPSVSIDYGVMEPLSQRKHHVRVVESNCGWSDVGSWEAAYELGINDRDDLGNVVRSDPALTVLADSQNNLVVGQPDKAVALVGVNDLVVVDTPDALLVVPRSRSQEVKVVVEKLQKAGRADRT